MKPLPVCILCTRDKDLARAVDAYARGLAVFRLATSAADALGLLQGYGSGILLLDLTLEGGLDLAASARERFPRFVVVALGMLRSEPAIEAEAMGLYAVEDRRIDQGRLQALLRQANSHLMLTEENQILRSSPSVPPAARIDAPDTAAVPVPSLPFPDAFRHFNNVNAFFESIVEGVARFAHVSRVGLFSLERGESGYRFRAGVKCLPEVRGTQVAEHDPLVQWLSRYAHVVSRQRLGTIPDPTERLMLQNALDTLGAEVIIPLHGHERIIGWLFVGHHVTGSPFDHRDIENLVGLAEHVSLILDNALLHVEMTVQKTLAETVLHSIPVGIVAADAAGCVRWFNEAAQQLLELEAAEVVNRPVRHVGSRLADLLLRAASGNTDEKVYTWVEPHSRRTLSVAARPLQAGDQQLGSVAMIQDLTRETLLRQKQEQVDRASFWAELAAAMSHEVRGPLVAISTYAQLLPERYTDEEFRQKFSTLVAQEVGRLDGMVEQINRFANPPDLSFAPLKVDVLLTKAVAAAMQCTPMPRATVDRRVDRALPRIWGDENTLVDCFAHLIANAEEAVQDAESPRVSLAATCDGEAGARRLSITIQDNGRGMATDIGDRLFSPFYTTKARGIGLGLPIARRTLTDHNGEMSISSSPEGTTVKVILPAYVPENEYNETYSGR